MFGKIGVITAGTSMWHSTLVCHQVVVCFISSSRKFTWPYEQIKGTKRWLLLKGPINQKQRKMCVGQAPLVQDHLLRRAFIRCVGLQQVFRPLSHNLYDSSDARGTFRKMIGGQKIRDLKKKRQWWSEIYDSLHWSPQRMDGFFYIFLSTFLFSFSFPPLLWVRATLEDMLPALMSQTIQSNSWQVIITAMLN